MCGHFAFFQVMQRIFAGVTSSLRCEPSFPVCEGINWRDGSTLCSWVNDRLSSVQYELMDGAGLGSARGWVPAEMMSYGMESEFSTDMLDC